MRRIIYVMPYTTIIEQNVDEFRKVLDQDNRSTNVLEHHSNMEPGKETAESDLLADNWDSPIVVTTSVQFFELNPFMRPSQAVADACMQSGRQSLSLMRHRQSQYVI
jgi:CRISPR-associated endonuclease/helicase Cas3